MRYNAWHTRFFRDTSLFENEVCKTLIHKDSKKPKKYSMIVFLYSASRGAIKYLQTSVFVHFIVYDYFNIPACLHIYFVLTNIADSFLFFSEFGPKMKKA